MSSGAEDPGLDVGVALVVLFFLHKFPPPPHGRPEQVNRAASRTRVGLSQDQLAHRLGKDRTLISHVEAGRAGLLVNGLVRAAQVLDVSADYLIGLTDDPAPVDNRVREEERKREELEAELQSRDQELDRLRAQATATAKLPDPDVSPIQSGPGWRDEDYETVRRYESEDVRLAAGTGTFADQEPVAGEVKFRTSWLREHHLRAKDLFGVAPVEWTPDLLREKGVHSAKNETTVRAGVPASNS